MLLRLNEWFTFVILDMQVEPQHLKLVPMKLWYLMGFVVKMPSLYTVQNGSFRWRVSLCDAVQASQIKHQVIVRQVHADFLFKGHLLSVSQLGFGWPISFENSLQSSALSCSARPGRPPKRSMTASPEHQYNHQLHMTTQPVGGGHCLNGPPSLSNATDLIKRPRFDLGAHFPADISPLKFATSSPGICHLHCCGIPFYSIAFSLQRRDSIATEADRSFVTWNRPVDILLSWKRLLFI